jgi:hypothetical protein
MVEKEPRPADDHGLRGHGCGLSIDYVPTLAFN